jgi:cell division protein ZapA
VAQVDREMSAIRDAGKVKARERIAVLAALNLAYQLVEAPKGVGVAAPAPVSSPEVDTLIKRLDEALGNDGQLL